MTDGASHEEPILVVLPAGSDAGVEIASFLEHPGVTSYQLPEPWCLEPAGVEAEVFLQGRRTLTTADLGAALARVLATCDASHFAQLAHRAWQAAQPSVREYYLDRSAVQTVASLFGIGKGNAEVAAPTRFHRDQRLLHTVQIQYRLRAEGALSLNDQAPPQEGSLAFYPFDPCGVPEPLGSAPGRRGALALGPEVVLEGFAYAEGRARHRSAYEAHGGPRGWRILDPVGP